MQLFAEQCTSTAFRRIDAKVKAGTKVQKNVNDAKVKAGTKVQKNVNDAKVKADTEGQKK